MTLFSKPTNLFIGKLPKEDMVKIISYIFTEDMISLGNLLDMKPGQMRYDWLNDVKNSYSKNGSVILIKWGHVYQVNEAFDMVRLDNSWEISPKYREIGAFNPPCVLLPEKKFRKIYGLLFKSDENPKSYTELARYHLFELQTIYNKVPKHEKGIIKDYIQHTLNQIE